MLTHQIDIGWREYAAFRYDDAPRGNSFQQLQGCVQAGFERLQIAVIDTD